MRLGQLGGKDCVLLLQAAGLGLSRFQAGRGGSQLLLLGRQGFQMRLHLGLDQLQIVLEARLRLLPLVQFLFEAGVRLGQLGSAPLRFLGAALAFFDLLLQLNLARSQFLDLTFQVLASSLLLLNKCAPGG